MVLALLVMPLHDVCTHQLMHAGLPSQSAGLGLGAASGTPWQPQGVLTAHLAEHSQGVNQLALAGNGLFFVSASSDETVKVWDGRRLERDVSFKSRLTYSKQGRSAVVIGPCLACRVVGLLMCVLLIG